MKVKIGDKIFDANDEPVLLIFNSEMERTTVGQHLLNMPPEARKYCTYPDNMDENDITRFMF